MDGGEHTRGRGACRARIVDDGENDQHEASHLFESPPPLDMHLTRRALYVVQLASRERPAHSRVSKLTRSASKQAVSPGIPLAVEPGSVSKNFLTVNLPNVAQRPVVAPVQVVRSITFNIGSMISTLCSSPAICARLLEFRPIKARCSLGTRAPKGARRRRLRDSL